MCHKLTYLKREASEVINYANRPRYFNGKRRKRQGHKTPTRSYYCEECGGWHLTSKE